MNHLSQQYIRDANMAMSSGVPIVATVAVVRNDSILMGLRRDNKKWTFPGGHSDINETPLDAAIREVREETGLTAIDLEYIGHNHIMNTRDGKGRHVFCFKASAFGGAPNNSSDPDREILEWRFVKKDMEPIKAEYLHSNPNALLDLMGWGY